MPIVPALCTQCGAAVQVNDAQDAAICPHCQTPFIIQKAIHQYHTTNHYQFNGGTVNLNAGPSLDELYKNARALILNGACVIPFRDEQLMSSADKALHALYLKMLGIGPNEDLVCMTRVALAIAARLRMEMGEIEAVIKHLPLLREKDPDFYEKLLDKINQRFPKLSNYNGRYRGGMLGLKTVGLYKATVDALLTPEEGRDVPFLIDNLYSMFWCVPDQRPRDYAYICKKIYEALPTEWQNWFAQEYRTREKIYNDVISALKGRNFKLAYELINRASGYYPEMGQLLQHFKKTLFSMKCTLSFDPALASGGKYYAPKAVHLALRSCPSALQAMENL